MDWNRLFGKIRDIAKPVLGALPIPEKAVETATKINQLVQFALPIAATVASITPSNVDDSIVKVICLMSMTVSDLLPNGNVGIHANLNRQLVTAEMLRDNLVHRVSNGETIEFGKRILKTKEDVMVIPYSILTAVATTAHAINKSQQ